MSAATTACRCPACRHERLARARVGAEVLEATLQLARTFAELRGSEDTELADLRRAAALMKSEARA